MTIETELRFLGILINRKPYEVGMVIKPNGAKAKTTLSGVTSNHQMSIIDGDRLVIRHDRHVIVPSCNRVEEVTVATSKEEVLFIGNDINRENFRVSGKRFPSLTKKLVWRPE